MAAPKKEDKPVSVTTGVRVKHLVMHQPCDLLGSVKSFKASRTNEMEATSIGVKMYSHNSKRTVVVPYANLQAFELFTEDAKV